MFFLLVVNYNPSVFRRHEDTGPYIFHGNDLDLLGSREVIGHVTIRCGFLLVVHCNHASNLHGNKDTGPQKFWGHDPDLLHGSRDVIDHVTIGLGVGTFLLVVNDDHALILHGYGYAGVH